MTDEERIIHEGHLKLVQRPYLGKMYDVVISTDAAVIMYIDPEDHVYFAKQYRVPMGKKVLELPGELMDKPGMTSLDLIVEGLEEECGVRINPSQVHHFATIASSEGHDTEMVDLFYAYGPCTVTEQRLEDSEKIEVLRIPFNEAYRMIETGELQGSKTVALLQHEYIKRLEKKLNAGGEDQ